MLSDLKKNPVRNRSLERQIQYALCTQSCEQLAPITADWARVAHTFSLQCWLQKYLANSIPLMYVELWKKTKNLYGKAYLQKDDPLMILNPSGIKYEWILRKRQGVLFCLIIYLAQSPDLNAPEGNCNTLKQRVGDRGSQNEEDLKRVLQKEWRKLPQKEIQTCIDEMPYRCIPVAENEGKIVKTELW